jgi:hypothetical protein
MRNLFLVLFALGCTNDFSLVDRPDVVVSPEDTAEPVWVPEGSEPGPQQTDPPEADDCEDTEDLVYVIDRTDEGLYLFDPTTGTFDLLGQLDCPAGSASPGSMAVSRTGMAYVRYSNESIYAVDLVTFQCRQTDYQGAAFGSFGMGYATQDADTWRDELYIANAFQLAELDTGNWRYQVMGSLPSQSELTGNAEGELWAFLPLQIPAELVQLDKGSGAPLERMWLNDFPSPFAIDAFAFATWGGDFWLFVREWGASHSTDVYRVTRDGVMTLVDRNTGMDIVGAGVSTCAPTE